MDQTGPMGQGSMTGRRVGRCTNNGANFSQKQNAESITNAQQKGNFGQGSGMGFGRRNRGGFGSGFGGGNNGSGFGMGRRNRFCGGF